MNAALNPEKTLRQQLLIAGCALFALLILLTAIGAPAVSRTQEARVLETARQMLPRGWHDWLIPRLNNTYRLQKPPLCYWLAAAAYKIGGVSEAVGRVPTALVGWLTLVATFVFARRLYETPTALLSCAMLLGNYLFFRNMRLAETDAPATLFVTLAIYCLWRSANASDRWLHAAAAALAGALLAKGGPVVYPILFTVGYAWTEKRWDIARRFFTSGAIVTLILLGAPWFAYVAAVRGVGVFRSEVVTVASGQNHWELPYVYIPALLIGTAPWCGVVILGLWDACANAKTDARRRLLLIWCGAIVLPLCLIGNKQNHYLLPLLPPLAVLGAHSIVHRTRRALPSYAVVRWLLLIMLGVGLACAVAILVAAHKERRHFAAIDFCTAAAVAGGVALSGYVYLRHGLRTSYFAFAAVIALLMPLTVGVWISNVIRVTPRTIAADIHKNFGQGPFLFFGPNVSLPLCFNLRTRIDSEATVDDLAAHSMPGTVVIAETKALGAPTELPPRFQLRLTLFGHEQKLDIFQDVGPR